MQNIVLGITAGIAAYKSVELARALTKKGYNVQVILTEGAKKFVSPITLQALTNNPIRDSLFDLEAEFAMGHIELARFADLFLIAPASADFMAKMAHGLADDLLSTVYLATNASTIVCPAMNKNMWNHPATQENYKKLKERGVLFVGPCKGLQACGDDGLGRMSEVSDIIDAIKLHKLNNLLQDKEVLITAGPTYEPIDPVRFIGNHSSGKMGYAIARAANIAGAKVTLISGPSNLKPIDGVKTLKVTTAKQMYNAVVQNLTSGMIFIGASAVADYTVSNYATQKIKKDAALKLDFQLNPDILSYVANSNIASFVVGFAAQTHNVIELAKEKLVKKNLDMIVANEVGENLGFNVDDNEITILTKDSQFELPIMNKTLVAEKIIELLAKNIK